MYRVIGGILLVAGTAIGAGMLAVPITTGMAGFFPSLALFIVFWIFMTYTAFLFLEANLWVEKEDGNMLSMAEITLGKWGKALCWIAYLYLLYALTTAYLAGGGPILNGFLKALTGYQLPVYLEATPLLIIFGYFVYRGVHTIDYVNRLLMLGLVISYFLIVFFLTPHVKTENLQHVNLSLAWLGASVVATSFGYHIVIPSLTHYLHRDVKSLRLVLWIGSAIPLIVYTIWEMLVLGIIPVTGPISIEQGYIDGNNGANLLASYLGEGTMGETARIFSLFAIVTSFLGVSTALSDFLADGFKIRRTGLGNLSIFVIAFLPPLLIALIDPRAFLSALEYAGAFGVVILLGILPILMVWRGRKKFSSHLYQTPGGNWMLVIAFIFFLSVVLHEIYLKL